MALAHCLRRGGRQPDITLSIEKKTALYYNFYNASIRTQSHPHGTSMDLFTTPAGVNNIVLRMVNNAPGGCGNDLALDDITFRPCGPLISGMIDGLPGYAVSCVKDPRVNSS
jgi:hypothetical protein